jgi:hypothetical protein
VAFEAEKQLSLHFAVRKDWPELVSVLDKTLASITQEERLAINAKWIDLGTETDYGPLIRNLLIAGSAVFLILLVSLCWVWILKREAARRVKIQEDLEKGQAGGRSGEQREIGLHGQNVPRGPDSPERHQRHGLPAEKE